MNITMLADVFTVENLSWAAVLAFAGALLYAAWQKGLRAWIVKNVDVLQDKIDEKIKPYVGDDVVKIRKIADDVESLLLGMVDIILARKFGGDVVKQVDKAVLVKLLEKAALTEKTAGHVTGQELYAALKVKLDTMPGFVDPKEALALIAVIEAHEKEEKDVEGLAAVDEAKKVL